jgi:hypothetical protein
MGTTRYEGPDHQPAPSRRASTRPHATRDEREDEPATQQRSANLRKRRCRRSDPWSDDAPTRCADPVDDYLTATRTRRTGRRVLESVIAHDGDVIAAVWVSDEDTLLDPSPPDSGPAADIVRGL